MILVTKHNPFHTVKTPWYEISVFENAAGGDMVTITAWSRRTGRQITGPNWQTRASLPADLSTPAATEWLTAFVRNHKR